ncbi:MAG TPA: DUF6600 domain-containing protein [Ignavibacteriaceae bacterium]|nr:DUF6600 domain-containing protein [Ignavibacteriaceae bacterium]
MKKLLVVIAILITGFITSIKSETKFNHQSEFEFGFFYSELEPYGSWIEIDAGLVAWRPTIIRRGWEPYRHGQWIWTSDGWYWDSYEPFGHVVFHYGRWYYDEYYGWLWIPDYDWAPAWVDWRYDDDYIGWAPLPPYAVFSINIGIHYTHDYYVPYTHWHYVKYKYFCDPYVYNYYVAPKYKYRIHSKTKYRHDYDYRDGRIVNRGVDFDHIKKRSGRDIKVREIVRVNNVKEVEKYRGKNNDVVRTYVASREEITKKRSNDVKIEKKDRKTSLDVSKVRLGRDDNKQVRIEKNDKEKSGIRDVEIKKNNESRNNVIKKERNNNLDINRKKEVDVKRNETIKKEQKKNNEFIPEKKIEKKDVQRNDVQKNKVNIQRKTEVKRNTETKRNNEFTPEKKIEKRDVQKNQVNRNPEIKRNVEVKRNNNVNRNTEVKKEVTNKNNNTFEQQKRENKTQVRTEQKRNENTTKNRVQVEKNNSGNNKNKRNR